MAKMENKQIASMAEDFVAKYFKESRKIDLVRNTKRGEGYDFRNSEGTLFVEVKGRGEKGIDETSFFYFTPGEYKFARHCAETGKEYEIHLVFGIGGSEDHYRLPGSVLLETGKPETWWQLPIRRETRGYKVS